MASTVPSNNEGTDDAVDGAPTADKFFNDASKDEDDLAFSQERGWYSYISGRTDVGRVEFTVRLRFGGRAER